MRKSRKDNKKEVIETSVVQEVPVQDFGPEGITPTDFILNNIIEGYTEEFGDKYMNQGNDLLPMMHTDEGGKSPTMNNLLVLCNKEMDPDRFNLASLYSLDDSAHAMTSVPTPFITFGQKVDHTFDLIDYVREHQNAPFQFNFANHILDTADLNSTNHLRAMIRHALVGFTAQICDAYRQCTRSINSKMVEHCVTNVNHMTYTIFCEIDRVVNTGNPASFSMEDHHRGTFDAIVNSTLVPTILGLVFEAIDREAANDIYNHSIGDIQAIADIIEYDRKTDEEKSKAIDDFYQNRILMSARDIHSCFTAATFGAYKDLQRELEVIINCYRIQLHQVYGNLTHDEAIKEMYDNGIKELEASGQNTNYYKYKRNRRGEYYDEF